MDLRFTILRIPYQNSENYFTVIQGEVSGISISVTGAFPDIREGEEILATGEWKQHPKYGRHFDVVSWQEVLPNTTAGLEKYLASGMIKGIGPKYAAMIVAKFGLETMQIIDNDIERLREVKGIGAKRIATIRESWERHHVVKNIMIFLQGNGVSTAYAVKIYKKYGEDSIQTVREDPYRLAQDIDGIGFKIADSIAMNLGYTKDDSRRCAAGVLYTLGQMAASGHCYAETNTLVSEAAKLLEVEEQNIYGVLADMTDEDRIVEEDFCIYLPAYYHAEKGVASRLRELGAHEPTIVNSIDVNSISVNTGVRYDQIQEMAIREALMATVMVLTGGPGTGKTTTTKGIIAALKHTGQKVLLAAPTGRAAKRMKEATGMDARTIHRLLEYSPKNGYVRNQYNPLEGDVLIVDECSMIDIILMYHLLMAVPTSMRLILIGDTDQLPSVGAGNVLNDIIQSRCFTTVRLETVFRQAQTSRIIMGAHAINNGKLPDLSNASDGDLFFLERNPDQKMAEELVDLIAERLPVYYKVRPTEIQLLTPMRKGPMGTEELNRRLQTRLNPYGAALTRFGTTYRTGDKVMQIKNNYDKNVFNGDIGFIESVDLDELKVYAVFDDKRVSYDEEDLDELALAYACTIHKSQGSEFPVVVMPITMGHYIMLQRNLVYTGITRARNVCVMIGEKQALTYAIGNNIVKKRNTRLKEALQS